MQLDVVNVEDAIDDRSWQALHEAQRGPANPFTNPRWVASWYRHFAPERARQRLCFVRSSAGELVGVAPLWLDHERVGPVRVASRLRLAGAGQGSALLELPQILTAAGQSRPVLGAILGALANSGSALPRVDLLEFAIADGQGWIEPQWLGLGDAPAASWLHVATQVSVIVPLGPTWPETLAGLKRNVKESLRRARNRLAKLDRPYEVVRRAGDLDAAAVDRFFDLHRCRAERAGKAEHYDAFAPPDRRRFFRELLPRLGSDGDAAIWELWLDGVEVAAQLVLHAPETLYVHSSGVDPSVWELGAVTHLQEHAFRAACDAGIRWVNMSPGPNLAKLRWSEQLLRHDEFWIGFGNRRAVWRQAALGAGRTLRAVAHNTQMAAKAK